MKKCVLLAFGIVLLILHTAIFSLMTTNYRIYTTFYFFQYSFDAPPIFIIFFVLLFSSSLSSHLPRGLIFNFICHIFNCTICNLLHSFHLKIQLSTHSFSLPPLITDNELLLCSNTNRLVFARSNLVAFI